jgi:hypothetical protein
MVEESGMGAGGGAGARGLLVHFAFLSRAMRLFFARLEIDLCTPLPPRRPERVIMSGVGTTSWFLLPCSTWMGILAVVNRRMGIGAYGSEDSPVL